MSNPFSPLRDHGFRQRRLGPASQPLETPAFLDEPPEGAPLPQHLTTLNMREIKQRIKARASRPRTETGREHFPGGGPEPDDRLHRG